jgi:carboxymethylenebutenolidase
MTHPQPLGFLAVPTGDSAGGVLVLHAWWGLNDTIKAFCTRLAKSGFNAFASLLGCFTTLTALTI